MKPLDRVACIRIELDGVVPPVWRTVEVPLITSLAGLHEVIQAVMLFDGLHLFQFDVGDTRYGIPDPEWEEVREVHDARTIKVGTLVDRGVASLSYTYDFGDNWQHTVTIESIADPDPALDYPRFVDGGRRAPPDDVGGIPGFEELLDAMAKPRHPERKRLIEWYGRPFDPDDIDLPGIVTRVGAVTRRRVRGQTASGKGRGSRH